MSLIRTVLFISLAVGLQGQSLTPTQQPELQALSTAVRNARRSTTAAEAVKAQVDKLIADAGASPAGEARRRMANALALLNGQTWDQSQEFAWSLALRPSRVVNDSSAPLLVNLSQFYSARALR